MKKTVYVKGIVVDDVDATGDVQKDIELIREFLGAKGPHRETTIAQAMFRQAPSFCTTAAHLYERDLLKPLRDGLSVVPLGGPVETRPWSWYLRKSGIRFESLARDSRPGKNGKYMKSARSKREPEEMLPEYDFASMKGGVRGKYADLVRKGYHPGGPGPRRR